MNMCDLSLWGNLKQKVYRNNTCTLEAPEIEIWNVIQKITKDEVQTCGTE
jgi:hypothetical protein